MVKLTSRGIENTVAADSALRRRFLFASLNPLFGSAVLENHLVGRGAARTLVAGITS